MSKQPGLDNQPNARPVRAWSITAMASTLSVFATQSAHAADSTTLGLPTWVFFLVGAIILLIVCFIPTKKGNKTTISKDLLKPTPQKPEPTKAPEAVVAKKPEAAPTPVAPAVVAPVVVAEPEPAPVAAAPEPEPAPIDAMVEAKQFIAQNRIPQAVGVLSKGLQREPERTDLMLELLTIYSKQNHHEAFDEMFEQLAQLDDPIALIQAEELRDQLEPLPVEDDRGIIEYEKTQPPVVGEVEAAVEAEPAPEIVHETLAFTLDEVAEKLPEPAAETAKDEFDLSDFDLDHSFELDKVETTPAAEPAKALDFTLADDLVAPTPAAPAAVEPTPDLEFKLPEPAVEIAKAPAAEVKAEDSGLVDLEFDLDDSFALDDDRTAVETAKAQEWTTDLGSEDFAAPAAKAEIPAAAPAEVKAAPIAETKPAAADSNPLLSTLDEEFPFLSDVDPQQTCLELAKSYISLGETDSARELLTQVIELGAANQQTEARALIAKLAS